MRYPKMDRMIQQLYERTVEGDIPWKETEQEDVYQVAFPNASIRVRKRQEQDDPWGQTERTWLGLYSAERKLMDEVLISDPFSYDLYDHARRTAMGAEDTIEDTINEILGSLDNGIPEKQGFGGKVTPD
uniref:Uncharacterized protein n=1 Tax=Candidatus Kentrum sp. LFY TaxID=2126342 RepID=A0A450WPR0_9GAMM|nr:MAG: hypothetical protein BECKLFY1418C_GA0070996_105221 [Candidatus Kentron sp. LFY]